MLAPRQVFKRPDTAIATVRLRVMMLLDNNRLYTDCRKKGHNLCLHGTCSLVNGGKPYTALLATHLNDKNPWTWPIPYGFLSSLKQLCLKSRRVPFFQIPSLSVMVFEGKPGLCSPQPAAEPMTPTIHLSQVPMR